ncbi:MAG: chitinase [Myxococcales bacterium]
MRYVAIATCALVFGSACLAPTGYPGQGDFPAPSATADAGMLAPPDGANDDASHSAPASVDPNTQNQGDQGGIGADDAGARAAQDASVVDGSQLSTEPSADADSSTPKNDEPAPPDPQAGVDAGPVEPNAKLADLLPQALFEQMFPQRAALYSYSAFLAAAAYYPAFAAHGTDTQRKQEVAAFLANIAHETTGGWDTAPGGRFAWGLYFTQEVGCEGGACTQYCDASNATYPCQPGKTYQGRGPLQLSWNYNYGQLGVVLGVDSLSNPDLVTSNGTLAFRTAFWFWMTAQSPKPSCHAVMTGAFVPSSSDEAAGRHPGMGLTIDIINGGIECGYARSPSVTDRLGFYARFTGMLGVAPGSNLDCDTMQPF